MPKKSSDQEASKLWVKFYGIGEFFRIKKNIYYFLEKNLAGPVNLVKLVTIWSQYVFEKKKNGLLYPTWTNFSDKIFSNDFLSCF